MPHPSQLPELQPCSQFVLGREDSRKVLNDTGVLTVSAYAYARGMRYSGPILNPDSKPSPNVLYRIRVKLKLISVSRKEG